MLRPALCLSLGLFLEVGAGASPAAGTSLRVSPLQVDLAPGRPPGVLRLHNDGDAPTLVQLETFAWVDGEPTDQLPRTDDLLAAPPIFDLAPGETQLVRLGLRRPLADGVERAYRLVIAEVPSAVAAPGGVTFVLRLSMPVFVTPPGAEPAPAWTASADGHGGEVQLVNAGTSRLIVRDLRVVDPDSQRILLQAPEAHTVLAGGERRWALDAGPGPLPRELTIMAVTGAGELKVTVPVQGG